MSRVGLPLLAKLWFLLTAPVTLIDGIFVLTRSSAPHVPHPLGDILPFNFWVLYATYDRRYAPNDDAFVVLQSWLNMVEVSLGLLSVVLSLMGDENKSLKLALIVSVMTLYKTVMYLAMEFFEGGRYTAHNTALDTFMMTVLPSLFWIVVPAIVVKQCWRTLSVAPRRKMPPSQGKKKKTG